MAIPNEKVVLTVDNDISVRELLADIARHAGCEALQASSSREALELLGQRQVHLILLDINLPGVNGQQFLRYIRKAGNTTPVIVISGFLTKDVLQDILAHGVTSVMTKPVDIHRLVASIQEALKLPQSASQPTA